MQALCAPSLPRGSHRAGSCQKSFSTTKTRQHVRHVSAQGSPEKTQHLGVLGRAGHVGNLCLVHIRIPDYQGEQVLAMSHVVLASSPGLGAIVSSWGKVGTLRNSKYTVAKQEQASQTGLSNDCNLKLFLPTI